MLCCKWFKECLAPRVSADVLYHFEHPQSCKCLHELLVSYCWLHRMKSLVTTTRRNSVVTAQEEEAQAASMCRGSLCDAQCVFCCLNRNWV